MMTSVKAKHITRNKMIKGSVNNDLKRVFLTRFKVAPAKINKNKLAKKISISE